MWKRDFEAHIGAGQTEVVTVEIEPPEQMSVPRLDWTCRVLVEGLGQAHAIEVRGVDALDLLANALVMAGIMVRLRMNYPKGTTLTWHGQPDLGLPPLPNAN